MDFLSESIIAYTAFDNALSKIEDCVKIGKSNNVNYFYQEKQDDKHLSDYVNSVVEMRKAIGEFNNLFEDFLMEIETAEQLKWEEEQKQAEETYYSEVQNEEFNQ